MNRSDFVYKDTDPTHFPDTYHYLFRYGSLTTSNVNTNANPGKNVHEEKEKLTLRQRVCCQYITGNTYDSIDIHFL